LLAEFQNFPLQILDINLTAGQSGNRQRHEAGQRQNRKFLLHLSSLLEHEFSVRAFPASVGKRTCACIDKEKRLKK
jgi:hypothetical protein